MSSPAGTASRPLLRIEKVRKQFGELQALDNVSLDVAAGEVVVVIGASGSGKSTLCRCINRLETVSSGTITIDGVPLAEEGQALARLRADVGMVFQSFNLFGHLNVLDNVTLGPMKVRGLPRKQAEDEARQLLDRVGVGQKGDAVRRADFRPGPGDDQRGARRDGRAGPRGHDHGRGHPRDGLRTASRGPGGVHGLRPDRRDRESAIGLRRSQAMRIIILPQAIRIVVPALVTQLVSLLKDSTLGYVVSYPELMRQGNNLTVYTHLLVQTYLIIALIYIVMNYALGQLAQWLERRLRRRPRAQAPQTPAAPATTTAAPATLLH